MFCDQTELTLLRAGTVPETVPVRSLQDIVRHVGNLPISVDYDKRKYTVCLKIEIHKVHKIHSNAMSARYRNPLNP